MAVPIERFQFTADKGDARLRLDQVLVRRAQDVLRLSRHVAQRWIRAGAVTVSGRPVCRSASGVREGAEVIITLPDTALVRTRPEAERGDLDILYEDEVMMAINKPPGIVVHPTYKTTSGTLLNRLLWHVRDRPDAAPSILTRLDKDTSGLVLVALRPTVHASVQRDAAKGLLKKQYLALVAGSPTPRAGRITLPLDRDPGDRRRVIPTPTGAPSETRYEVVSSVNDISVVRCELVTGRTHQIRVHLAATGWPILGDKTYGVPHAGLTRQALHAWRVALPHPATGRALVVEAPIAADIQAVLPADP
jgi:23S rRNA pseudouridine1911/1915/1917 synthase